MKRESKYEVHDKARAKVREIAALEKMDDIETFAPLILAIMDGVDYRTWHMMDEQSSLFDWQDRFYMLRRVRNSQVYRQRMFDGFTG